MKDHCKAKGYKMNWAGKFYDKGGAMTVKGCERKPRQAATETVMTGKEKSHR